MLNTLPVMLAVGAVLGFLSGLGVGGGSLLMLWMTLVLKLDYNVARNINLLFFLPAAAIASYFRRKEGALQFRKVLPAIAAGCISAAIFTWASHQVEISLVKKLFGFLLLVTGARELLYRARNAK